MAQVNVPPSPTAMLSSEATTETGESSIHFRVVPSDDGLINLEWIGKGMNPSDLDPFKEFVYLPGSRLGNTFRVAYDFWSFRQWVVQDTPDGSAMMQPHSKIIDVSEPCVRVLEPLCAVYERPGVIWSRICATTDLESRGKRAVDLMGSISHDDQIAFCEVLLQDKPADPLQMYQRTVQVLRAENYTDEIQLMKEIDGLHVTGDLCQFAAHELLRLCKKRRS